MIDPKERMAEICANCGLSWGSHRGGGDPISQCPEHEGKMDWVTDYVTVFERSGRYFSEAPPYGMARHRLNSLGIRSVTE